MMSTLASQRSSGWPDIDGLQRVEGVGVFGVDEVGAREEADETDSASSQAISLRAVVGEEAGDRLGRADMIAVDSSIQVRGARSMRLRGRIQLTSQPAPAVSQ